ncbi:DUF6802 family protein [Gordonia aurantiaca]|uniref:DUF6802 family protein n=1 Tax=Gordonia sp. B21 TaxID=3151852 RepID=UPI003266CD7E
MDSIFDGFDPGDGPLGPGDRGLPEAEVPGIDPGAHFETVAAIRTGPPADDLDAHLWMHEDGRIWDLGPAEVDTDNDGVNDSLTRNGPDGFTVYTDSDHDGQVDKITEIGSDGEYSSAVLDPETGEWIPGDSGRIG